MPSNIPDVGQPVRGDPDDAGELFREAIRGATPLDDRRRAPPPRRPRVGLPRTSAEMDGPAAGLPAGSGESLHADGDGARAFGVSRKTLRQLATGRMPIEATLDLHRHTVPHAREHLERFVARCRAGGVRAVLVITGKADRSPSPRERLRDLVPTWLSGPLAPAVLGFVPARAEHGGAGALYVLLRSSTP
jgi:DNA-nicking Smr family endonuclease